MEVVRTCKKCGVVFSKNVSERRASSVAFCSGECRLSLSSERLIKRGKRVVAVEVRTEDGKWVGKSVFVLETLLGRKLSQVEKRQIVHIDGDCTNCTPDNLILKPGLKIVGCKHCGRVLYRGSRDNSNNCSRCWAIDRRSLTSSQAGLVKACEKVSHANLSKWFNVSSTTISNVRRCKLYRGVEPMAKDQVWRALLQRHDELMKKSGAALYDRVKLLEQVYTDPHFIDDMRKEGKSPVELMNTKVADTCANFTELLQMLKMWPSKRQWVSGNLSKMRTDMLDKLREDQRRRREEQRQAREEAITRVGKSTGKEEGGEEGASREDQGEREPAETTEFRQQINRTRERHSATVQQVRELQEENRRLKAENERLIKDLARNDQMMQSMQEQLNTYRLTTETLNRALESLESGRTR